MEGRGAAGRTVHERGRVTGEPGKKRRFGASEIAALAATVAALAAVAVAVWDNVQQREFYRLSVVPSLDYLPSKEGTTEGAIALTNAGVGPAKVRHTRIALCGGSEISSFASWNAAREALRERGVTLTAYHDVREGEVVASGRTFDWARFESRDTAPGVDRIQDLLDALAFRIRYVSVYDEPFVVERRPECLSDR